jgi:hypothetical protein
LETEDAVLVEAALQDTEVKEPDTSTVPEDGDDGNVWCSQQMLGINNKFIPLLCTLSFSSFV